MERTVVLVKPDGVQRGLIGEVISRFERKGLKLVGLKMMRVDDVLLDQHYARLKDRAFFVDLKRFMKSSPIVAMVWEGLDAISVVRNLIGPTVGREAAPGTIRGDFSMSVQSNVVHASDSQKTAVTELRLFFKEEELFDYYKDEYFHIYGLEEMPDKFKKYSEVAKSRR